MSQVMPYEAWRITYQSSEQAARAAYEAMVELQGRATTISESDRLELTAALGLLRGHQYHGSADALERVLRGAGSPAAVQQGVQPVAFLVDPKDGGEVMLITVEYEKLRGDGFRNHGWAVKPLYTHPTQQGLDALTQAARSVLAERARQISAEGYTPEQDDGYNPGVLALHGGLYACHAYDNLTKKRAPEGWQWDAKWWKSKDPRSNLVKAGALILAEIERMDRSFAAQAKQGGV